MNIDGWKTERKGVRIDFVIIRGVASLRTLDRGKICRFQVVGVDVCRSIQWLAMIVNLPSVDSYVLYRSSG
jgi:hypothetical protein